VSTEYALEEGPLVNLQLGTLRQFAAAKNLRFLLAVTPETEDGDNSMALLYFGKARPKTGSAPTVFIDDHCPKVADLAKKLAGYAGLSEEAASALQLAGQLHDLGKQEDIWQKAAGNLKPDGTFVKDKPVAKPIEVMRGKSLGGFRHELASLRYAEKEIGTQPQSTEFRDLVLHLVAAHHGHARPCFESKAYDRRHLTDSARIALESAQRFARMQERYGAWGLAYLESILRAADWMVSAATEE
jgi:CRISPR-associated endonuclease/helicase Cas3